MVNGNVSQFSTSEFGKEFEPILRLDLTEEIIDRIKVLMARGKLKPGSKLPPEREFARLLGVGRPALRQALKALSTMGIIDSRVGKGTFVSLSTSGLLTAPMDFMVLLHAVTLQELFEVRKVVEVELAGWAADRATDDDLLLIKSILEIQKMSLDDSETFLEEDLRFHRALSIAAHNILFTAILESLSRLMTESRRKLLLNERDLSNSFRDHQNVFREIREQNRAGAREAMFQHLDRVYHNWEATQKPKQKGVRNN